jgi:hypothetical protein
MTSVTPPQKRECRFGRRDARVTEETLNDSDVYARFDRYSIGTI